MSVCDLYFKDNNKNCKGGERCNCIREELPYSPYQEILVPLYRSVTMNEVRYYYSKIKDISVKRGKVFLHIEYPFIVGDLFIIQGYKDMKYFMRSESMQKDKMGSFVYNIEKTDNSVFEETDIKRFKPNRKIIYKGHL